MASDTDSLLQVAVGVLTDPAGRVLVARRADHTHQGGLWEFPGGKVEPRESLSRALARELFEELGIEVVRAAPLIRTVHQYPERRVLLDVHEILNWSGKPRGQEGQPLRWLTPAEMDFRQFPEADRSIITALRLPRYYVITGGDPGRPAEFMQKLRLALDRGYRLFQLRAHGLSASTYRGLAQLVIAHCRERGARVLLNTSPELASGLDGDGLHITSRQLSFLLERPVEEGQFLAVSCHDADELARAQSLGADFVVLSPVRRTASHPDAHPLGWAGFARLVDEVSIPVYALGGMGEADVARARGAGAQGVAGIRGFWPEASLPG